MKIFNLDNATIASGKAAYNLYRNAIMSGPSADNYKTGMGRQTGLSIVPGAILAFIEQAPAGENEIVPVVARVSRCKRSTVEAVLFAFVGNDPERHLWTCDKRGDFRAHANSRTIVMLAA